MTRFDLREVVLVEEDDERTDADDAVGARDDNALRRAFDGDLAVDATADDRGARRSVVTARRLVALGALALLAATAVVVGGVQDRARAARLAEVRGLLAPLGPDVREAWRVPAGWGQMATIGGDLLLGRLDAAGEEELVGIDSATGEEQWVSAIPEADPSGGEIWCETFGDADAQVTTHVACRLVDAGAAPGRRAGVPAPDDGALLLVIDTATGERVAERELGTGYSTLESLGDDLVVVQMLPDGHVGVTRSDPVTGRERWTFRSDEPLPVTGRRPETPVPVLQHDVLLVAGATGWALSPEDGRLLGEWDLRGARLPALLGVGSGRTMSVLPDGRFAVARPEAGSARPGRYGTVSPTDRHDGFAIPGPLLQPLVDDGSAADVVLTSRPPGGALTAQDAVTGQRRWSREAGVRGDSLVLDDRLMTIADDAVTALDLRTGETLWSVSLEGGRSPRLMTDGDVVLAGLRQSGDSRALVAWGVEDGRERWRAPLPANVETLRAIGGRLVGFGGEHVVGFGQDAGQDAGQGDGQGDAQDAAQDAAQDDGSEDRPAAAGG